MNLKEKYEYYINNEIDIILKYGREFNISANCTVTIDEL